MTTPPVVTIERPHRPGSRVARFGAPAALVLSLLLSACGGNGTTEPDAATAEGSPRAAAPAPGATTPGDPSLPAGAGTAALRALSPDHPGASAPKLTFENMTVDFGVIPDSRKQSASFAFTNTGTGTLRIAKVTASCGCTAPTLRKKTFGPGESGTIDVTFNPLGKKIGTTAKITVVSNTQPETTELELRADVHPMVRKDRFLKFERIALGEGARRIHSLRYVDPNLVIERVTTDDPHISARVVESGAIDSSAGEETVYRADVEVTVDPGIPWGPLYAKKVYFDVYGRWRLDADPERATYYTYLSGRVFGELEANPAIAAIGRISPGADYRKIITITRRSGRPFSILSAAVTESTMPGIQTRVIADPQSASRFRIVLSGNVGSSHGAVKGRLEIETDVPGETRLSLPVTGGIVR